MRKVWTFKNGFPTLMTNAFQQIKTLQFQCPRLASLKEWEKITLILVPYLIGCISVGICIGIQGERTIGLKDGLILPLEFGAEIIRLTLRGICNFLLFLLEFIDCINDRFSSKSCSPLLSFKPSIQTLEVLFAWTYLTIIGIFMGSILQERYRKLSRKRGGGGVKRSTGTSTVGRAQMVLKDAYKKVNEYRKPILLSVAIVVFYIACSICICSKKDCSTVDYALAPLTSVLVVTGQLVRGVVAGLVWILGCPPAPTNPKPLNLPKIEIPSVKVPQIKTPDLSKIEVPMPHLTSSSSKSWSGWITLKGSNWVPNFGSDSSWSMSMPWPSSKALTSWIPKARSVGSKTIAIPTIKLREVQPPKMYLPTLSSKQVSLNSVFSRLVPVLLLVIPLLCLLAYLLVQCILMISAKYQRQKTALNINQDGKWEYGSSNKKLKLQMKN